MSPKHPAVVLWVKRKRQAELGILRPRILADEMAILEFCEKTAREIAKARGKKT